MTARGFARQHPAAAIACGRPLRRRARCAAPTQLPSRPPREPAPSRDERHAAARARRHLPAAPPPPRPSRHHHSSAPLPTAGESLLASSTRTSGPNSSPTPDADEVQGASSPGVPRRWRSAGWAPGRARRSEAPDRVRRFCSAYSSSPGLSVAGGRGRTGGTPPRQPPPGSPCGEKLLEPSTSTAFQKNVPNQEKGCSDPG